MTTQLPQDVGFSFGKTHLLISLLVNVVDERNYIKIRVSLIVFSQLDHFLKINLEFAFQVQPPNHFSSTLATKVTPMNSQISSGN